MIGTSHDGLGEEIMGSVTQTLIFVVSSPTIYSVVRVVGIWKLNWMVLILPYHAMKQYLGGVSLFFSTVWRNQWLADYSGPPES